MVSGLEGLHERAYIVNLPLLILNFAKRIAIEVGPLVVRKSHVDFVIRLYSKGANNCLHACIVVVQYPTPIFLHLIQAKYRNSHPWFSKS